MAISEDGRKVSIGENIKKGNEKGTLFYFE